jgi:hypothetical protein
MALPEPIVRSLRILQRQRAFAQRVIGGDPPGMAHHPEGDMEENLRRTVAAIEGAGSGWALVGAQAINLFIPPRATEDFDLVVSGGRFAHVLKELRREFGDPPEVDLGAAVRFPTLGIDLIRSTTHALFGVALERAVPRQDARVPPVEVLIALKFLSTVSPWRREEDRKQDALDLIRLYRAQAADLDRAEMVRLGGLAYPGAEREFTALIDKLDRGDEVAI